MKTLLAPRSQAQAFYNERPLLAHYDPGHPGRAVLHPGITFGALFDFVAGLAAIVGGLLVKSGNTWVWSLIERYRSETLRADRIGSFFDT